MEWYDNDQRLTDSSALRKVKATLNLVYGLIKESVAPFGARWRQIVPD